MSEAIKSFQIPSNPHISSHTISYHIITYPTIKLGTAVSAAEAAGLLLQCLCMPSPCGILESTPLRIGAFEPSPWWDPLRAPPIELEPLSEGSF